MVAGQPRLLELRTFDLVKVYKVDVVEQQFKVQFFVTFAFPNGAKDANLTKLEKDETTGKYAFGFDENGAPNWLPSAGWFMDQFDTNNGIEWAFLDKNVFASGDDMLINLRIEGTFFERLELYDFPFDVQELTMSLAVNTRTSGNTPVELRVAENANLSVDMLDGFQLSQFYTVATLKSESGADVLDEFGRPVSRVDVKCFEVGTSAQRMFPSISFTILIARRPSFYVYNVTVPLIIFVMLSYMQFCVDPIYIPDRLSISLTLVLTTAAYKFAVASLMPTLSYMTLLDEYVLASWLTIVLVSFAGGTVGLLSDGPDVFEDEVSGPTMTRRMLRVVAGNGGAGKGSGTDIARSVDILVAQLIGVFWFLTQLYFAYRVVKARNMCCGKPKTSGVDGYGKLLDA